MHTQRKIPMAPEDAAKAGPASADLDDSVAETHRAAEAVQRLIRDIDAGPITIDGLPPVAPDDTLVRVARQHLRSLQRA